MSNDDYSEIENEIGKVSAVERELLERLSAIHNQFAVASVMNSDVESRLNDVIDEIESQLRSIVLENGEEALLVANAISAQSPREIPEVIQLKTKVAELHNDLKFERKRAIFLENEIRKISAKLFDTDYEIKQGAYLHRANLTARYLRWANLMGADMTGADLAGADLSWADLRVVNLTGATLRDTTLCGALLHGAILVGADLAGADLTGADLTSAYLDRADLSGATMPDGSTFS